MNMLLVTLAIIAPTAAYAVAACVAEVVSLVREMRKPI